jgi:hypothetical protein
MLLPKKHQQSWSFFARDVKDISVKNGKNSAWKIF